jgi:glutathione S-transferase
MAGPTVKLGSWFIVSKYDAKDGAVEERIRKGLTAVREAVGKKDYVLDSFSFADILGASVVQTVHPLDEKFLRVGSGTKRLWHHEELATEFADVVAWRDRLYEKHRPPRKKRK